MDRHVVLVAEFYHVLPRRQGKIASRRQQVDKVLGQPHLQVQTDRPAIPEGLGHADRQEHGSGTVRACQVGHRANPPEQSGHRIQLRLLQGFAPGMPPEEHRVPEEVQLDAVQVIALADLPDFTEGSFPRRRLAVIDSEPGAVRRLVLPRAEQASGMVPMEPGRVVDVVHPERAENLDSGAAAELHHRLQGIDSKFAPVPSRSVEKFHCVVADRIHLRPGKRRRTQIEQSLSRLRRGPTDVSAVIVENDAPLPVPGLLSLLSDMRCPGHFRSPQLVLHVLDVPRRPESLLRGRE